MTFTYNHYYCIYLECSKTFYSGRIRFTRYISNSELCVIEYDPCRTIVSILPHLLYLHDIMFAFENTIYFYYCFITYSSIKIMHLYIVVGFYAFHSVFAVIYNLYVAHSCYFISGFWCEKQNYKSPYFHILAMPFNIIFCIIEKICYYINDTLF